MSAEKLKSEQIKKALREGRPCRLSDGKNLFFVITKRGTASWVFRFTSPVTGKQREGTLGSYPELSLAEARKLALEWRGKVVKRVDPLSERHSQNLDEIKTVAQLWENFAKLRRSKISTQHIEQSLYTREIKPVIGRLNVADVDPLHIEKILDRVRLDRGKRKGRPTTANKTLLLLKALFNRAVKMRIVRYNVAEPFDNDDAGGKEQARDRHLNDVEITQLFDSMRAAGTSFARENLLAVALLLILGNRKMELLSAEWQVLSMEQGIWFLRRERNKEKIPLKLPLEPEVVAIFRELRVYAGISPYVFPLRRKAKKGKLPHVGNDTLNRALEQLMLPEGFEHFVVHDLRRTCRTYLSDLKVSEDVAERYINHKRNVYNKYDFFAERREAQRKLIDRLWPLMGLDKDPNLTEFVETELRRLQAEQADETVDTHESEVGLINA